MFFFRYFPTINYDIKSFTEGEICTNLTSRFKIQDVIKNRSAIYFTYSVKEGEKPQTVAVKYYGDPALEWLIFLTNQIHDPQFEWPLSDSELSQWLIKKFGSIRTAKQTIKQYEWVKRTQSVTVDGNVIPEQILVVDEDTYNSLPASERRIIYEYDYWVRINENRRNIKLLDRQYAPSIINQVRNIFN